jgi:hypothetical protein
MFAFADHDIGALFFRRQSHSHSLSPCFGDASVAVYNNPMDCWRNAIPQGVHKAATVGRAVPFPDFGMTFVWFPCV